MFWSRARTVLLSCATREMQFRYLAFSRAPRHEERESPRLAAPESQPGYVWCPCLCPRSLSGVPVSWVWWFCVPAICLVFLSQLSVYTHATVFSSNGNLVCWACAFPQRFQKASRVFPVLFAAQVAERRRWKFRNRTPLP